MFLAGALDHPQRRLEFSSLPGMETTAISLTYVAYLLASRQDMWDIMRTEIGPADLQAEDFVDTLRKLPYLNAFIRVRLPRQIVADCADRLIKGNTQSSWASPSFLGTCCSSGRGYIGRLLSSRGHSKQH